MKKEKNKKTVKEKESNKEGRWWKSRGEKEIVKRMQKVKRTIEQTKENKVVMAGNGC